MAEQKFEKDLEKLEEIVEALETGGLSLDDAMKKFEEGVKLARRCEKALCDAEKKIEILVKNAQGEVVAEPFDEKTENGMPICDEPPAKKEAPAQPHSDEQDEEDEDEELLF